MIVTKQFQSALDSLKENFMKPCSSKLDLKQLSQSSNVMQAFIVEESAESIEEDITDEDAIADEDNDDDICSSYTSTSSIPDEDINFDLVYARHTFVASIDGQASVVKGDTMVLIDDTNSYWWLIRALKTSEVGYIPAELVETPHERLARLNKHRNVEVTSIDKIQYYTHQKSSFTNFDVTATTSKSRIAKKRVRLSRTLACQKQILFYSNYDDDIEIDKDIDSYTATYEEYTEEIPLSTYLASENDENFVKSREEGKKKSKYAPLINPYFNKPKTESTTTTIATHNSAFSSDAYSSNSNMETNEGVDKVGLADGNNIMNTLVNPAHYQDNALDVKAESNVPAFSYPILPHTGNDTNVTNEMATNTSYTDTSSIIPCTPPYLFPNENQDFRSELLGAKNGEENEEVRQKEDKFRRGSSLDLSAKSTISVNAVSGLKKLLSFGKKSYSVHGNKDLIQTLNTTTDGESINQDDMTDKHYHVLRIFAGDSIQTGTSYNTVTITPEMNADELLKLTLQKFHISLMDDSVTSSGIEFYLTVKSMDSDEITLMPQDKPLSIFESLSDHLTEPMPSLKILKRLSREQPSIQITRVGVSKARKRAQARFGDDSLIRFSLHKRIKRVIDEVDCDNIEHMYIKLCFYAEDTMPTTGNNATTPIVGVNSGIDCGKEQVSPTTALSLFRKSSLLKSDQQAIRSLRQPQNQAARLLVEHKDKKERFEKLVPVSITTTINELIGTALEKFHIATTIPMYYYMTLSISDEEIPLDMNSTIVDTLNDSYFNFQGCSEKLFVLRSRALQYTNNGTGLTLESNNGPTKKQVLHAQAFSSPSSVTSVGKNKKPTRQVKNSTTDSTMVKNENNGADSDSNGNKLIRRLLPSNNKHDIDKNSEKYAHQRPILVNLPARSNSLSAMSTVTYNKSKVSPTITLSSERLEHKILPMRSSSLRIQTVKSLTNADTDFLSSLNISQHDLGHIETAKNLSVHEFSFP